MFSRLRPLKQKQAQVQMDEHAAQVARFSEEMITTYRQGLKSKLHDPTRLAEVYGHEFASADFKAQAENICMQARRMIVVPNAMVSTITADEQVKIAAKSEAQAPARLANQDGFCENVIGTGRPFAVDDSGKHALVCNTMMATEGDVVSYLGVPVVVNEQIVGVLCVWEAKARRWTVSDVSLLTSLSTVLSRAVIPTAS